MFRPTGLSAYTPPYSPYHSNWNLGIESRDRAVAWSQSSAVETATDLYVLRDTTGGTEVLEIQPRPTVRSIGTTSRPYRLLRGQEIQISEDDIRIEGVSKRYLPNDIAGYGCYYRVGTFDGGATYDLVLLDATSDPLTYNLTLRKREDNRNRGYDYDLP